MQTIKECRQRSIHHDFETHGQSHLKSETVGTSVPQNYLLIYIMHLALFKTLLQFRVCYLGNVSYTDVFMAEWSEHKDEGSRRTC